VKASGSGCSGVRREAPPDWIIFRRVSFSAIKRVIVASLLLLVIRVFSRRVYRSFILVREAWRVLINAYMPYAALHMRKTSLMRPIGLVVKAALNDSLVLLELRSGI